MNPNLVYIPTKGYFNPIADFEWIKWYYEFLKRYSKSFRTRCINEFLDANETKLEQLEAYELLGYMRSQVTQKQRDKRKQTMALTEIKSDLIEAEIMERVQLRKKQKQFLSEMKGTICLN